MSPLGTLRAGAARLEKCHNMAFLGPRRFSAENHAWQVPHFLMTPVLMERLPFAAILPL
jgi:hypothetical protein